MKAKFAVTLTALLILCSSVAATQTFEKHTPAPGGTVLRTADPPQLPPPPPNR
jgi:Skp family chaperone for outer membrane proteins